jgi:hypothetical protein
MKRKGAPVSAVPAVAVGLGALVLAAVTAWFGARIELACTRPSEQARVQCELRQLALGRIELDRVVMPDVRAIEAKRFASAADTAGRRGGTAVTSLVFAGPDGPQMPGYFADLFLDDLEHLQLFVYDRSARSLRLVEYAGHPLVLNGLALLMAAAGVYLLGTTALGLLARR